MTALLADSAAPGPQPPLAAQWKKIDALLKKDQTASAAPLVEKVYQQAKKENNAPAYVRALLYKIRLLDNKENDADEKAIALLEADLKTAQFPARPILHSLLAGLYADYYNQHRYQLYERTQGAAPTADQATPGAADGGTTLATWDAGRLGAAIVRHYYQSVEDEPQRQLRTTLAALGDLAVGGDAEGRALRPTLYDLLAHRAIEGLQNQELYITRPEQQFQATDPKLFGSAQEFAALKLAVPAADSLNGQLHALQLLQRLTAARLAANNPAALADVDLQRLRFLRGLSIVRAFAQEEDYTEQYTAALTQMAETYKALPISTEFMARRAQALRATDPVAAVALARAAEARFPKSRGAAQARVLREEIERPEITFSAADIVVPGQPWRLDVTARNVTELHAFAYRITLREWETANDYNERNPTVARRYARALKAAPAAAWAVPVPAHPLDYKEQKLAVAGAALPVGHYLVVLTNQSKPNLASPAPAGSVTAFGVLGASELTALRQGREHRTGSVLLVLHRQSGLPLSGVSAQGFYAYERGEKTVKYLGEIVKSAASGEIKLASPDYSKQFPSLNRAKIWRGRDTLLVAVDSEGYPNHLDKDTSPARRTFLFTDRAIYRPGQTVYFKGLITQSQGSKNSLLTGQSVSVRLLDVNGQTAQTLTFTTSDYGSFNGSLVLPTGLLNGQMTLQTDDGSLGFQVEDYKRPTFLVTLDSVPGRPQLGQPLALTGRARAYAGQATDGATVKYRVTRRELWPLFSGYGRYGRSIYPPGGGRGSQEITHGTTTTDAEGRFTLSFTPPAAPRQPGRRGWEPGYLFEITADVTDAAGETRTGTRNVVIGRNPLNLQLAGPERLDRQHLPALTLLGTNATGEPLPATGTLRLLARRYRPNPPGVPGPAPETEDNEAPAELVKTLPFDTRTSPALDVAALLAGVPTGRYRLEAQAAAPDTAAHARLDFVLYDAQAATIPYATPDWVAVPADTVAPGQPARLLLGSSEPDTRILLEVERGGQLLRQEWLTLAAGEQRRLEVASGPATAPGPLYIHTTQVRAGRLYVHTATVQVAERPQPLRLSIATFRDRLQPGQRETWRVTIHQANGRPAEAELLATLYDQSLDIFRQHSFQGLNFGGDYYPARFGWQGSFEWINSESLGDTDVDAEPTGVEYPELNDWQSHLDGEADRDGLDDRFGGNSRSRLTNVIPGVKLKFTAPVIKRDMEVAAAPMASAAMADSSPGAAKLVTLRGRSYEEVALAQPAAPDLSTIAARSDFRETAFWQPALYTDKNGDVVLEFQMPEAVTRWQLLALAHDKQLRSGQLARQLVTQKEIQLTPNAPRFLRPGDAFTFPARFSNLTDHATSGTAQLFLLDAATGQDITSQLLQGPAQQAVAAAAHQSVALGWALRIPADFTPVAVTYRVVAQAGGGEEKASKRKKPSTKHQAPSTTFSDGEENTLPVLPNKILITESLPLPLAGPGTRAFELKKLTSTSSPTRRNQSLTLELTANPAWYAVQSLPYLMEYPYECSEQVFSRLYANLLAAQILKANPRFKTVLAEWQRQAASGTAQQREQLASKLAQNQELKNLLLQETPWVRDAQSETERLTRLSTLFDEPRLTAETARALAKLQAMQLPDGSFPWFEKMPADRYLTQLIVAGFGKLKKLNAFDASQDATARVILQRAVASLDAAQARDYTLLRQQKGVKLTENHLGDLETQALYARSFWPALPVAPAAKAARAYYLGQAAQHWLGRTRYLQAQLALALHRDNQPATAQTILRALTENALHSPDLGMYWKDVQGGYYWREAPTETQATLIEAFDEVKNDQKSVDEMKLWLLTQKQTHSWESTRATADACYALLLRGTDWSAATQPLQATVGGEQIQPAPAQAGIGYLKTTWPAADIKPAQGKVTLTKTDAGPAWGALYWQYFEDIDKVTPAASPLSVERQLYRETRTATGPALEKITTATPLRVGDALVVRLVLRTDRALEYVHLKDQRAAGLEPINQLSGYRYQNGLGYYESPRDAATNFFLSEVPRGTHVFEYRLRASQAGDFSGGLSQVQCLYAPEFGATSAGQRLQISGQAK
ncbi:MAG TPA: MG2 domain-containing protein [Hymenobacter sp.]|uniref:alpha-2-macroglobulin family protein n=1 Tax=Hymenobacter sp. TaxID=1898978 RepID=UPI002D7F2FC9|nr:MG2 domain-containing protein [Hymenobacter sp.]HET9505303.1 MG2 domain-containing protein [Hymenobacter sp.]